MDSMLNCPALHIPPHMTKQVCVFNLYSQVIWHEVSAEHAFIVSFLTVTSKSWNSDHEVGHDCSYHILTTCSLRNCQVLHCFPELLVLLKWHFTIWPVKMAVCYSTAVSEDNDPQQEDSGAHA